MGTRQKIAFLGLGVMGGPMAAHLANAGHIIAVWNRSQRRLDAWRERNSGDIFVGETIADTVSHADIAITCVGNDEDLAEVALDSDGILEHLAAGGLLIDHTTTSAAMARRIGDKAGQADIQFIDAPVSGGQAGAENGTLAIMCGGTKEAMSRAEPIMDTYAARIVHVGATGAGQTTKMANQMCIAGVLGGLSEAIRLAMAAGLDTDKVLKAISGGAAQSWQMENRWDTMVRDEFDFGFAVDWMRKDLRYALAEADRLGLAAPVTSLVDRFYAEIQAMGGGRQDTSSLIRRLPTGEKQ